MVQYKDVIKTKDRRPLSGELFFESSSYVEGSTLGVTDRHTHRVPSRYPCLIIDTSLVPAPSGSWSFRFCRLGIRVGSLLHWERGTLEIPLLLWGNLQYSYMRPLYYTILCRYWFQGCVFPRVCSKKM